MVVAHCNRSRENNNYLKKLSPPELAGLKMIEVSPMHNTYLRIEECFLAPRISFIQILESFDKSFLERIYSQLPFASVALQFFAWFHRLSVDHFVPYHIQFPKVSLSLPQQ